jgi:hypothetical protein
MQVNKEWNHLFWDAKCEWFLALSIIIYGISARKRLCCSASLTLRDVLREHKLLAGLPKVDRSDRRRVVKGSSWSLHWGYG